MPVQSEDFSAFDEVIEKAKKAPQVKAMPEEDFSAFDEVIKKKGTSEGLSQPTDGLQGGASVSEYGTFPIMGGRVPKDQESIPGPIVEEPTNAADLLGLQNAQTKKDLYSKGYDVNKLTSDLQNVDTDLLQGYDAGAFTKDKLLQEYKENPQKYEDDIAYLNFVSTHRKAVAALPKEERANFSEIYLTKDKEEGKKLADKINQYGGDYKRELLNNLSKMTGDEYKFLDDELDKESTEKGSRLGYIYNSFLNGIGSVSSGASDVMMQILTTVLPEKMIGGTKEEALSQWRNEVEPVTRTAMSQLIGADVGENKQRKYEKEFWTSAIGGLAGSVPMMVSPYGTGLFLGSYDAGLQSINNTEEGKKLPESTKSIFAVGVGLAGAALEKVGLDKIFGKQSKRAAIGIASKTISDLLEKSTVPITKEVFEAALNANAKTIKQKIIGAGGKIGRGASIEALTGASQEAANVVAEKLLNALQKKEVFQPQSMGEIAGRVIYAGAQEGVGGGLLGGVSAFTNKTRNYISEKVAEAKTPEDIQKIKNEVIVQFQNNRIQRNETDQLIKLVDDYANINSKVPENVENRKEVINTISERDEIKTQIDAKQQELNNADDAFKPELQKELNALQGRYDELNEEAVAISKGEKLVEEAAVKAEPQEGEQVYRVDYKDEQGNPATKYFRNEEESRSFYESTPGEKTGYYDKFPRGGKIEEVTPTGAEVVSTATGESEGQKVEGAVPTGGERVGEGAAEAAPAVLEGSVGVGGDMLNENEFSETQTNVKNEETRKLINAVAEIYGRPLYIGDFTDKYISRLQDMGDLGYEVSQLLNAPKRAAKLINEFAKKNKVEQSIKETTKAETETKPETAVGQDVVIQQMKPFTDEMVKIEREFENNNYEIRTDYDNEIIVTDKDGEIVDAEDLPSNLLKLAQDYEKAVGKLGEFDASAMEKALSESRKVEEGQAEVVETEQAKLPPIKEGATAQLPPQVKGGISRDMVFKDGEWQQQVGGQVTKVGAAVQQQAQQQWEADNKLAAAAKVTPEAKPTVAPEGKPKVAPPSKAAEKLKKAKERKEAAAAPSGMPKEGINVSNKSDLVDLLDRVQEESKKRILQAAQKGINTLKSIFPDMDIYVHETADSYNEVMPNKGARNSRGNFSFYEEDGKIKGRIDINLSNASETTVAHEITHAILLKQFGEDLAAFKQFRDRISKVIAEDLDKELVAFEAKYKGLDVAPEEYLTQLAAILATKAETVTYKPSTLRKIAAIINELVTRITNGKFSPFKSEADFKNFVDFLNQISGAIREGKEVVVKEPQIQKKGLPLTSKYDIYEAESERPELAGDRGGRIEGRSLAPLEGAPSVPEINGPDPRLVAVAEKYAKENGIPLRRQAEYVKVDEGRAKRIADAYEEMKHDPQNPKVKEAYDNLIKQTIAQYKALTDAGYKFWFIDANIPSNAEYASSPYNALRDARKNKEMGVFPTTDGFGSDERIDVSDNPLMAETGFYWSVGGLDGKKKPVLANDLFRAVHDMFGHGLEGAGFRARGEENAWQAHIRLFTGSAIGALTSETRGQNSWLNYGPHGEKNKNAKVEDTVFADQKTGLMPEWTWTEGRAGDQPEIKTRQDLAEEPTAEDLAIENNPNSFQNAKEFANESKFSNKIQFKNALQKRIKSFISELKKVYGKSFDPSVYDEKTFKYLSDVLTKESFDAIREHPEAIGWYDAKTKQALAVLSTIHPEIAKDKEARGAFILSLAIMSNGNKVDNNFDLAEKAYRYFKDNKRFYTEGKYGAQQIGIKSALKLINSLLDNGLSMSDINDFLTSKYDAKDLKITVNGKDKNFASGELAKEKVYGAIIFGSKIGNGFYMNLWGEFGQLTMDRWFMRTWGRLTGTLIDIKKENIQNNRERLKSALEEVKNDQQASEILKSITGPIYSKSLVDIANILEKKSAKKDLRSILENNDKTKELKLAANNYAKAVRGEKEAPANGSERKFIREVFDDVQKRLKKEYEIDISMADLQAVLWYPEKILYESFKEGESFEESSKEYTEESAPDYLNAAKKIAKKYGIEDNQINAAIRSESELIRPTEGIGDTGSREAAIESSKESIEKFKKSLGDEGKKGKIKSRQDLSSDLKDVESTAKALEGVDKSKGKSLINGLLNTFTGKDYFYHGTTSPFSKFKKFKKMGVEAIETEQPIFLAQNKNAAEPFSTAKGGRLLRVKISQDAKLFDPDKIRTNEKPIEYDYSNLTEEARKLAEAFDNNEIGLTLGKLKDKDGYEIITNYIQHGDWDVLESKGVKEWLIKNGYDGVFIREFRNTKDKNLAIFNPDKLIINEPQSISEAYHKAKEDGTNPELVNAVEDLLSERPTGIKSRQDIGEDYSEMKDIVQDYFDEGISLDDTIESITSELGDSSQETKDLITRAYNELKGGKPEEKAAKPEEAPKVEDKEAKKEFDELISSEIDNFGTFTNYLSGKTIKKYEGDELRNEQQVLEQQLRPALERGLEIIQKAKEVFGDNYVAGLLNYLETASISPEKKALAYVSLENELAKQKMENPSDAPRIEKLQDLVRAASQAYLRSNSLAINFGRLRKFAEIGYDVSKMTDRFFSSRQLEDKKKIEEAIQAKPDQINKAAEEKIKEDEEIKKKVEEGVEAEIAKLFEKFSDAKKKVINKSLSAIDKAMSKLSSKSYKSGFKSRSDLDDAMTEGFKKIKRAMKAGISPAEAIEIGIKEIKSIYEKEYGTTWTDEAAFRKDLTEALKAEGAISVNLIKKRIEDLESQIKSYQEKIAKGGVLGEKRKEKFSDVEEVQKLIKERDELRKQNQKLIRASREQSGEMSPSEKALQKRIEALEEELDRVKERRRKEKPETNTPAEKKLTEREKELIKAIELENEKWDAEIDAARQRAKDYEKLETERNRQLKKVGELKEKLEILKSGKLPEGKKIEPKADTPEIESLKKELEDTEKQLRKNLAHQRRLEELEKELQRLKDRKEKEKNPKKEKEYSYDETLLRDQIEKERLDWKIEKNIEKLNKELDRVRNRREKTTDPKQKRELTDEEKRITDEIKEEQKKWSEETVPLKKLEKDILKLNKQIEKGQKDKFEKKTTRESEELDRLRKEKAEKQAILEALDPTPRMFIENALIEQGFGREINVRTKDGVEKRMVLDWKKLAGEEGSVDNIRERVESALRDKGYSEEQILRMKDAFVEEYNNLAASIAEKALNEINAKNKEGVTIEQKSAVRKLVEMYNYGLFDKDPVEYEIALAKTLGVTGLGVDAVRKMAELGQTMSNLFNSNFEGQPLNESTLRTAIQVIEEQARVILNMEALKGGNWFFKGTELTRMYMDVAQRMMLNTFKQGLENPISGLLERFYSSVAYAGKIPETLNAQQRKLARDIYKEIVLQKGLGYGNVGNAFITTGNIDAYVHKLPDSALVQGIMSVAMGKTILDAVDSSYKAKITQQKFTYNLIKILTKDRVINGKTVKGMSLDEAKKYVAEKISGQSFEKAKQTAKEIIDRVNKDAGRKIFNDSPQFVNRLANDIVNAALINGEAITEEMVTAAYNAAYRAAGRGLGHVSNNYLTSGVNYMTGKIETQRKKAIEEKRFTDAAFLNIYSMLFRNVLNPFVGGGTNWIVLKAEKTGLGLISGFINKVRNSSKIDMTSETGMKELEDAMYDDMKANDKFTRGAIGGMVTALAFLLIKGTAAEDEYEKWIKKNPWAKKYINVFTPELVLLMIAANATEKDYKKYLENTLNLGDQFDKGKMALKVLHSKDHLTQFGTLLNSSIGSPLPWRLVRDGQQLWAGATGGEPYVVSKEKPKDFFEAYLKGGMIDFFQDMMSKEPKEKKIGEKFPESKGIKWLEDKNADMPELPNLEKIKVNVDNKHPEGKMTAEEQAKFKEIWEAEAVKVADQIQKNHEKYQYTLDKEKLKQIRQRISEVATKETHEKMSKYYKRDRLSSRDEEMFKIKILGKEIE